jgi:hypothetical protein
MVIEHSLQQLPVADRVAKQLFFEAREFNAELLDALCGEIFLDEPPAIAHRSQVSKDPAALVDIEVEPRLAADGQIGMPGEEVAE